MTVLVAYASRHGSTRGIAERIAAGLRVAGVQTELKHVEEVQHLEGFDAFVIGSAAYMFHWLKEATSFVKKNRARLAAKPVWLFSSGPLGTDRVDDNGNDVLEVSRPKEFDQFQSLIRPRGEQVFFGAWDPTALPQGVAERFVRRIAGKVPLPAGDFRDWAAIDEWTAGIAADLGARVLVG